MDSTTTITCDCGAKVRLPENRANRSFRCPKCEQGLAVTADFHVLHSVALDPGHEAICPICQSGIGTDENCVTCPSCDQVHHRECWSEIGGCGTYGCKQASVLDKSESTSTTPLTAWGDTKKCPACGEEIKAIALRCRFCQTEFDSVDPMSVRQLHKQAETGDQLEAIRKGTIGLFACSLVGICAPLILVISLVYLLPRRDKLKRCGPVYTIMGWTSVALSAVYCLMIVFFLLVSGS